MTKYEYYSVFQKWLNTNTNTIWLFKNDTIRIRILFVFPKITEYEYEYSSTFQKWPNTNTNAIFLLLTNYQIWIRLLFGFSKMTKYEFTHHQHNHHHPSFTVHCCFCGISCYWLRQSLSFFSHSIESTALKKGKWLGFWRISMDT